MFGKPLQTKSKYSSPRDYTGVSDLASFILSPTSSKSPNSAKSAISPKKSSVGVEELISVNTASNTTSETESPSRSRTIQNPLKKTGDSNSFWLSANDNVYIERAAAMKCYRVVSYRKLKKTGKRVVFDILDGKPMYCGVGVQRKITDNAVVFTSKQDALSERFPSNQFEGTKSGNGRHPRVLLSFDVWGHCKRRHGGGSSLTCEFARFLKVVEYLDPPHPRVRRLVHRNEAPHMFPKPDTTKPNRGVTDREVKIYRMFNFRRAK